MKVLIKASPLAPVPSIPAIPASDTPTPVVPRARVAPGAKLMKLFPSTILIVGDHRRGFSSGIFDGDYRRRLSILRHRRIVDRRSWQTVRSCMLVIPTTATTSTTTLSISIRWQTHEATAGCCSRPPVSSTNIATTTC